MLQSLRARRRWMTFACLRPRRRWLARKGLACSALCACCAALFAFFVCGCADQRSPAEIEAHPVEWLMPGSADFHGTRVAEESAEACRDCHGTEWKGEARAPGCDECHRDAGGHPWGWMTPGHEEFHGNAVALAGPFGCRACHGQDYRGGWAGISCFTCHAGGPSGHPGGWMDPRAASFHGYEVQREGVNDCTRCHGEGLTGGTSRSACSQCHG